MLQVKPIKHGSFGSVVLADDRHTGVPVALKFIKKGQVGCPGVAGTTILGAGNFVRKHAMQAIH